MANYDAASGQGTLRLEVNQISQNTSANFTTMQWKLYLICGNGISWNANPTGWEVVIHGIRWAGDYTFDFRGGSVKLIAEGLFDAGHKPDGTQEIGGYGYSAAPGVSAIPGSMQAQINPNFVPTPIGVVPPAPTNSVPSFAPTVAAGGNLIINTNRVSSDFTHTIQYSFRATSGTIATGVVDTTTWAVPLILMNQIPNSTSGVGQITTSTYNNGTLIGVNVQNVTITVPSSIIPNFTTITATEATTSPAVSSVVGAFVQGISKLALAITGSVGTYASTIKSYKITVAGQTINASTGTTGVLSDNGTLTITGTVTDSRGRSRSKSVTVSVLTYVPTKITESSAVRCTVGGTVTPDGTYIKVNIAAVVRSLIVGTQRNNLTYAIRTRVNGSTTAWTSITPVVGPVNTGATGYNDDNIIGTYSLGNSYTVRVTVVDNLGQVAAVEMVVSTGGTLMHLSKTVDGIGIGKYHERGSVDAKASMYHRNGLKLGETRRALVDWNTAIYTGYYDGWNLANAPLGLDGWWFVRVLELGNDLQNHVEQVATPFQTVSTDPRMFRRIMNAGVWKDWVEIGGSGGPGGGVTDGALYAPDPTGDPAIDTPALRDLILQAQATNGTLYLQAGTYRVTTGILQTLQVAAQPKIVGKGEMITTLEGVGSGTTLKLRGATAENSGGYISDLSFTGTGTGLELQNTCFVTWDRIIFRGNLNIGLLFHNQFQDDFTEYCAGQAHFQSGVARAVEYRKSPIGAESFHGSGLTGESTINTSWRSPTTASILIGSGAIPYNSPMHVTWWVNTNQAPLIAHNGHPNTNFNGVIRIETFIGTASVNIVEGTSLFLIGGISTLSPGVNNGSLRQVEQLRVINGALVPYGAAIEIEKGRTAWSPTLTGFVLGNGTISATYKRLGRTVTGNVTIKMGTTSSMGSNFGISLPIDVRANPYFVTDGIYNNGSIIVKAWVVRDGSTLKPGFINTATASGQLSLVGVGAPFAWGNGGEINISFAYDTDTTAFS